MTRPENYACFDNEDSSLLGYVTLSLDKKFLIFLKAL